MLQLTPQLTPSHEGWPLAGGLQAKHASPQLFVLSFGEQNEPHRCVPSGQVPSHGVPARMHVVPHTSWPSGHSGIQVPRSHRALPPVGAGQGSHSAPHVSGARLETHTPLQS